MQVKPDPRIAKYIAEIEQPGIPYVSRSHHTRYALCIQYGSETVDRLIEEYFEAVRNQPKD